MVQSLPHRKRFLQESMTGEEGRNRDEMENMKMDEEVRMKHAEESSRPPAGREED